MDSFSPALNLLYHIEHVKLKPGDLPVEQWSGQHLGISHCKCEEFEPVSKK